MKTLKLILFILLLSFLPTTYAAHGHGGGWHGGHGGGWHGGHGHFHGGGFGAGLAIGALGAAALSAPYYNNYYYGYPDYYYYYDYPGYYYYNYPNPNYRYYYEDPYNYYGY